MKVRRKYYLIRSNRIKFAWYSNTIKHIRPALYAFSIFSGSLTELKTYIRELTDNGCEINRSIPKNVKHLYK